jgi:hypothetical protein
LQGFRKSFSLSAGGEGDTEGEVINESNNAHINILEFELDLSFGF